MATVFERAAKNLCLSKKAEEAAWAALPGLRMGPEDIEVVQVVLHYALMEDAERVKSTAANVLSEARNTITNAAAETAENIQRAAAKVEKASSVKLAAQQTELVTKVSAEIAASADKALTRKVAIHSRNSFASWIAAAIIAAAVCGGAGYYLGKANEIATDARVQSVLSRESGTTLVALADLNNFDATYKTYCQTGSEAVHRVADGTYCQLPLWVRRDGVVSVVPGAALDPGSAAEVVRGYLLSWGPYWLLSASLVLFVLIRWLVAVGLEINPLRRLLLLPVRSAPYES